jgi:hypothetical protein
MKGGRSWQAPVDQYPPRSGLRKLAQKLAETIKSGSETPHHGAQPGG